MSGTQPHANTSPVRSSSPRRPAAESRRWPAARTSVLRRCSRSTPRPLRPRARRARSTTASGPARDGGAAGNRSARACRGSPASGLCREDQHARVDWQERRARRQRGEADDALEPQQREERRASDFAVSATERPGRARASSRDRSAGRSHVSPGRSGRTAQKSRAVRDRRVVCRSRHEAAGLNGRRDDTRPRPGSKPTADPTF